MKSLKEEYQQSKVFLSNFKLPMKYIKKHNKLCHLPTKQLGFDTRVLYDVVSTLYPFVDYDICHIIFVLPFRKKLFKILRNFLQNLFKKKNVILKDF